MSPYTSISTSNEIRLVGSRLSATFCHSNQISWNGLVLRLSILTLELASTIRSSQNGKMVAAGAAAFGRLVRPVPYAPPGFVNDRKPLDESQTWLYVSP